MTVDGLGLVQLILLHRGAGDLLGDFELVRLFLEPEVKRLLVVLQLVLQLLHLGFLCDLDFLDIEFLILVGLLYLELALLLKRPNLLVHALQLLGIVRDELLGLVIGLGLLDLQVSIQLPLGDGVRCLHAYLLSLQVLLLPEFSLQILEEGLGADPHIGEFYRL